MLTALVLSLALAAPADVVTDPAARIARQPRLELGSVSYDGHMGDTSLELARITALGDGALPIFLAMARSPSPVARVAAAAGLVGRPELEARAAIGDLAQDKAVVEVMYGCMIDTTTVAEAVHHVLRYGVV